MKKFLLVLAFIASVSIIAIQFKPIEHAVASVVVKPEYIIKEGLTISGRVMVPVGFTRDSFPKGSFKEYVSNYKLKPFGSKVINYDGNPYFFQQGHIGILDMDVPSNGLQQCADALIRIRSEYLWKTNQKDKIGFNFTSGHYCSWKDYANGYRPKIEGNKVTFHKTSEQDNSKENFYKYLNLIFNYSGTLSLYNELPKVTTTDDLQVGDMLILGGTPGHIVMIADRVTNKAGEARYLLVQGNTPAQSVHLLKNFGNADNSPWYELNIGEEISVPGYTFSNSKFVRFK